MTACFLLLAMADVTAVVDQQDEVKQSLGPCGSAVMLGVVLSRLMLVLAIKLRVLYWLLWTNTL